MSDAFLAWQRYSQETPDFAVGKIVSGGCAMPLAPDVVAAYDAPFTTTGTRPGRECSRRWCRRGRMIGGGGQPRGVGGPVPVGEALSHGLLDSDPITRGGDRVFQKLVPGAAGHEHPTLPGGGHFLQEDIGPRFAEIVAEFVRSTTPR